MHGEGSYYFGLSEEKYVGEFRDGLAHGKGVNYYSNGDYYVSTWKNGRLNGACVVYLIDSGERYETLFVNGSLLEGSSVFYDKNGNVIFSE